MVIEMKPVTGKKSDQQQQPKQTKLTKEILDDLSCRFIINVPEEERQNLIRICFQIELAHWFYLDFYCGEHNLKPYGINQFALHMFRHIPFLRSRESQVLDVLKEWREYKRSVPTFGAILLNEDMTQVLLVQSFWTKTSWGFPKGKVNQDEDPLNCAVREVYEEIGFDIGNMIKKDDYIETVLNDQINRLYIVPGVSMQTKFIPQTRNEIGSISWFPLDKLPSNRRDHIAARNQNQKHSYSFYMILPFIRQLKSWVSKKNVKAKLNSKTGKKLKSPMQRDLKDSISNGSTPNKKNDNINELTYQTQEFFAMFPERYSSPKTLNVSSNCNSPTQTQQNSSVTVTESNAISEAKLKEFFALFPQCLEVSKSPIVQKDPIAPIKVIDNFKSNKIDIKKTNPWPEFKFNTAEIMKYF
ncbi:m7GpppN-mRNA hydrolase [Daktulosphaira vitifoliae]|uniref:m7GpppN-mRNA hydrolase n=1 Tax=Daktulosphaira vitifoliae TaxID=58002 RepID=UPI0021A9AF15|nr:m7GpppN-mRNA hydrolase [Daktulosphaira vitifoliae]